MSTDIFSPNAANQLLAQAEQANTVLDRAARFRAAIRDIETADDLQSFLTQLFDARGLENADVEVDGDSESLSINVDGVGINDDGVLVNPLRTFTVSVTVTLTQEFEVEAFSEEDAVREFESGGDRVGEIDDFGWEWSVERTEVEASERW